MNLKRYIYMVLAIAIGCCQYLSAYADGVTTASKVVGTPAGEFSVSPLGAAVYTMSIDAPKGYGKMQPNIALVYNSQSGYGIAGYGVSLSGLSAITRGSKDIFHDGAAKGMSHEADDAYYLDGKRLIYQSGNKGQEGAVYVPEGEPYTKVTFHGNYNDSEANTWIEVVNQDGITYQYGRVGNSTIIYTAKGKPRIHAWMINRASDVMGRYINYVYQSADLNCIPLAISYGIDGGVVNSVLFTYEVICNANTQLINIEGQKGRVSNRLKKITTATSGKTYRTYECVYDSTLDASKTRYSRLTQLVERNGNGEALNPITLSWKGLTSFTPQTTDVKVDIEAKGYGQVIDEKAFLSADVMGFGNGVAEIRNARKEASLRIDSQIDPNAIVREALASPTTPNGTGTNSVYVGVDDKGVVRYVGITKRDPARRFAEHRNSGTNRSGLEYHVLDGTGHLSRTQARIIEQKLINAYKMQQNGGILYNQRNSIELFK